MKTRSINSTVTFKNPFSLPGMDKEFLPGTYAVETDEELIGGLSFLAYRRTSVRLLIPVSQSRPGTRETLVLSAHEFDLAVNRDKCASAFHESKEK